MSRHMISIQQRCLYEQVKTGRHQKVEHQQVKILLHKWEIINRIEKSTLRFTTPSPLLPDLQALNCKVHWVNIQRRRSNPHLKSSVLFFFFHHHYFSTSSLKDLLHSRWMWVNWPWNMHGRPANLKIATLLMMHYVSRPTSRHCVSSQPHFVA